ncbi:uncharacterized protein LOC143881409 isoform X2 [Tasmannia lanceolata]|uniref:uncharacterized protein LOC143881409 isoform X2 n=1 Tax=Tasmannia lanceolata TaxID=3420 RepID=UPI004064AC76
MGSIGDESDDTKEGNSISNESSGEDFKDGDGNEIYPLQSGETQVLEDQDCSVGECEKEIGIDSDAEGTDRTYVLSDGDGVPDDLASPCKVNDFDGDRETGDDATSSGKMISVPAPCSHDQVSSGHHISSASVTYERAAGTDPGSVHRSFTSVRAASLRSSGLPAAHSITPKITKTEQNPTLINSQPEQKQDISSILHSVSNGIGKDIGITSLRYQLEKDRESENSHQNMQGRCREETRSRIKNSRARKLFAEGAPSDDEETIRKIERTFKRIDSPQLVFFYNTFAGLSYVRSQEPGEESQANALDVVDKLLTINDVEPSGEVDPVETLGEKLPPVSSGKGPQSLAKRADLRSPVGKEGIFDWIDNHEDERGGDFFSKRRDEFFESRDHTRKSLTQPRKPKHPNLKRTRRVVDELEVNEGDINPQIHQKIIGLTHSDSRLMLHKSIKHDKVQISETKSKKNIIKDLDDQLIAEPSGSQLETTAIGRDSQGIYDIGIDTQLAAEAMEALVCGSPANHESKDAHLETRDLTKGSTGDAKKKKTRPKRVLGKRVSFASDSEGTMRQSKRTNIRGATLSKESSYSSRKRTKDSRSKDFGQEPERKSKRESMNCDEHNSVKGKECSSKKSSGLVEARKAKVALNETCIKAVDICHNPLASNGHGVIQGGTTIPVAFRTRQSTSRITLKRTEISFNDCVVSASESLIVQGKCRSDPIQNRKPEKINMVQSKVTGSEDLYKEKDKTSFLTIDAWSYPRKRRTRRSRPDDLANAANLNDHSILNNGVLEAKTQSSKRRKGSRTMYPKDFMVPTSGTPTISGWGGGASSSISPVKDAEENATFEVSLEVKIQPSGSATITPVSKSNTVSPICTGDDSKKQSGKKGFSSSSLKRELIRLDVPKASPTPTLKDIRRRRDMASVRVLLSRHLGEDIIKQQKKILARLGASIASTSRDATHFVADKFARTRNMLEAMALGKTVVTHMWLESCGQASCFIDEKNYILRDLKKEKEIGFNMAFTLACACQTPLLQGKRVFATPNVKPDRELITSLVKAAQGQAMERIGRSVMKDDKIPDDLLVISCEEDHATCVSLLEKGAEVYSSELLLNGIVIQKLEYERHRLFRDHVKRTRSTIWLRNEDGNQFHPVAKRT